MKVLYVGSDSQVCGASFSMAKLIDEEEKLGIEIIPVVRNGNTERILKSKGKKYYIVNAQSWMVGKDYSKLKIIFYRIIKELLNMSCYLKYKRIIKMENPDIIHINALTTYSIAQAAIALNKPIVWHIREMMEEDLNGKFWNKKKAYQLMNKANYFIAISRCVENKYKEIVGEKKIKCIYNGIDKETFFCGDHIIFNNQMIMITMAGRITEEKGQLLCLKSLIPILKKNKNIVLQFAGEGNQKEINKLIQIQNDAGLSDDQVKILGFVKNMDQLWKKTDIAIIYSKFEAFGRVTIEAKMAGALVLGFNSGGTSELIENGVDGYLFDDEEKSLESIINFVLNNQQKCRAIANAGRDKASKIFTSSNNANEIYELYQQVLHEKN